MGIYDLAVQGMEEIVSCKDCGMTSAQDVRGHNAFTNVLRGGGCIRVCRECAAVDQFGQSGLMAVLIRETRYAASRAAGAIQREPTRQPWRVVVCEAKPPTADELAAHALAVARYVARGRAA